MTKQRSLRTLPQLYHEKNYPTMQNKPIPPTFHQDCQTGTLIHVKSNWLAMSASFIGWIIMLAFSVGMFFLYHRYFWVPELWEGKVTGVLYTVYFLFIVASGLFFIYKKYFPRQWMTTLAVSLEEKTFTIVRSGKATVLPFSQVSQVIHQGVATIFSTNYLFWAEVDGERVPLVAFTHQPSSLDFFLMLERRTGLKLFREEGN